MSFSLNEIEGTAKRAARGAGYTWGVAEEAGKATRWLCAQGLDGATELAFVLEQGFPDALNAHTPRKLKSIWAADKDLCPLMTGAALSDCARILQTGPIEMRRVSAPLLLLPFVANAAQMIACHVTITFSDFAAVTDGAQLSWLNEATRRADRVQITRGGSLDNPRARHTRATPNPAAWGILTGFAHRTYAPATEESRLLGAGAGLSDND